ncbi:DNA helicase-2 / ATP-dependent DNA helicase PcrA [Paenibacillus sp. UNCCL117]|uniref:HelD family protein n=1 Tax=unclassified Paenibacillus TaxID=185978 RepID=UPI0008862D54|nr:MULTISPECIES: 3'-5' exonuclease [unclassified Paenibacillus]SDC51164.1 DNA helicase-2 / ATP-dependent DNA helicase PcrA [Paenibacillus sp. cl123]SFW11505.1 DNA helicase-2 / ATP-dependent DNA helicase PcrA [Paenibacillus sp. UNCCL117]
METALHQAYQEELDRLARTIREMEDHLSQLEAVPRYTGHDVSEQVLESIRENKRHNLAHAMPEPYFGRLDFQEAGKPEPTPLYIGKFGVEKADSPELLVIDWRAPVASLFYSFTGGLDSAAYESPDGTVEGLVYLKRNLAIRKRILQRVVDTFDREQDAMAVTDEFLLYRLGENKDNKLRDIVSTIQAEQDAIIRAGKNDALVIQGVAGSGKTTVALHRLAFLLYQYRDQVKAEKMIIFAPNRMFLDYISGVLPELGVGHIQQTTFSDWALELLDREVALSDPAEKLNEWFRVGPERPAADDQAPGRLKGSLRCMQWIADHLDAYERQAVPQEDFHPWEGKKLPAAVIRNWFEVENKHEPLMKRRERVLARIKRWAEMELEKIWEVHLRKEYKKKLSSRLRDYGKRWTAYTPFTFYKELFAPEAEAAPFVREVTGRSGFLLPDSVREATLRLAKKKKAQPEDLAPMLFIRERFFGIHPDLRFDHTVIDEAQDFSPFQVAVLNRHTKNGSFTILGDLSQGIHAYQGVHRWEELLEMFPADSRGFFTLNRSYRSTMEIIHYANAVLERAPEPPATLAVPVFRSGREVTVAEVQEPALIDRLADEIRAFQAANDNGTLAILTRTEQRSSHIYERLLQAGCEHVHRIGAGQQHYEGGVSVLPVYMAKGLEFDSVIIIDADRKHYERTTWDAKLLYVGCTRALHELKLIYSGEVSPLALAAI